MSKVLRETIPMRTGMSLPGLSADKAAGPNVDEIKRNRISLHPVLLIVSPWMIRRIGMELLYSTTLEITTKGPGLSVVAHQATRWSTFTDRDSTGISSPAW